MNDLAEKSHFAAIYGLDELGNAIVENFARALDAALADIKHLGGVGLRIQGANWRLETLRSSISACLRVASLAAHMLR